MQADLDELERRQRAASGWLPWGGAAVQPSLAPASRLMQQQPHLQSHQPPPLQPHRPLHPSAANIDEGLGAKLSNGLAAAGAWLRGPQRTPRSEEAAGVPAPLASERAPGAPPAEMCAVRDAPETHGVGHGPPVSPSAASESRPDATHPPAASSSQGARPPSARDPFPNASRPSGQGSDPFPTARPTARCCGGGVSSEVGVVTVDDLLAMGFSADVVQAALDQAGGDMASAQEILLEGSTTGTRSPPCPPPSQPAFPTGDRRDAASSAKAASSDGGARAHGVQAFASASTQQQPTALPRTAMPARSAQGNGKGDGAPLILDMD